MPNKHGDWIWYELMTPDMDASAHFYGAVIGWHVGDQPDYREIETPQGHVGGMLPLSDDMMAGGAQPGWIGYVAVDDVDASVAAITAGGGRSLMPARDLPEAGRIAMVADPQDAPFYVMRPRPMASDPDGVSNAFAYDRPMDGHCAWNELATDDPAAALAFYGTQFGWVKDGDMDMGPMGKYEFLRDAVRAPDGSPPGHGMIGAVMPRLPEMPRSAWTFYFRVPDIDVAVAQVGASGGTVIQPPIEIPGGDFSMMGIDPQGAAFALVGKRVPSA